MRIPSAAKRAIRSHVDRAVSRLNPARYHQEPAYVGALFAKLDDVVFRGKELEIEILSTIVNDRGPGSAESIWGADFAVVAVLTTPGFVRKKAVLGQAKRGTLSRLTATDERRFVKQVRMMGQATWAIAGLEVPETADSGPLIRIVEIPRVYGETWAAQSPLSRRKYEIRLEPKVEHGDAPILLGPPLDLSTWIADELIYCSHGDEDERFVSSVAESSLQRLQVNVRTVA